VIFCPKYRRKVLTERIASRLKKLIHEKQEEYGYNVLDMEVLEDHVHLLLDVNPRNGVFAITNKIKGYTSHVLRREFSELRSKLPTLWTESKFISSVGSVTLEVVKKYIDEQKTVWSWRTNSNMIWILTESSKARKIAEYAIKYRTFSSKDVKHIGLKSMIANQILRKFGNQRKARSVKSVKLIIPYQGIKLSKDSTTIEIPCLKCSFQYRFPSFEKVNQIEIGNAYVYITVTVKGQEPINTEKYLGVDLNATGHVAVVSDPDTGKVWKLGKSIEHIHKKYKNMRSRLQSQHKYKKIKQVKNRESRIIRNLNHHISKKIADIAVKTKSGIRLERLTNIRNNKKNRYKRNLQNTLHSSCSHLINFKHR
jgi:putative transposase